MITPWGKSQNVSIYKSSKGNIYRVHTSNHGGYLVPKSLAARMPIRFPAVGAPFGNYLAFEEDCPAYAVEICFPDVLIDHPLVATWAKLLFELVEEREKAFNDWYPDKPSPADLQEEAEALGWDD